MRQGLPAGQHGDGVAAEQVRRGRAEVVGLPVGGGDGEDGAAPPASSRRPGTGAAPRAPRRASAGTPAAPQVAGGGGEGAEVGVGWLRADRRAWPRFPLQTGTQDRPLPGTGGGLPPGYAPPAAPRPGGEYLDLTSNRPDTLREILSTSACVPRRSRPESPSSRGGAAVVTFRRKHEPPDQAPTGDTGDPTSAPNSHAAAEPPGEQPTPGPPRPTNDDDTPPATYNRRRATTTRLRAEHAVRPADASCGCSSDGSPGCAALHHGTPPGRWRALAGTALALPVGGLLAVLEAKSAELTAAENAKRDERAGQRTGPARAPAASGRSTRPRSTGSRASATTSPGRSRRTGERAATCGHGGDRAGQTRSTGTERRRRPDQGARRPPQVGHQQAVHRDDFGVAEQRARVGPCSRCSAVRPSPPRSGSRSSRTSCCRPHRSCCR